MSRAPTLYFSPGGGEIVGSLTPCLEPSKGGRASGVRGINAYPMSRQKRMKLLSPWRVLGLISQCSRYGRNGSIKIARHYADFLASACHFPIESALDPR